MFNFETTFQDPVNLFYICNCLIICHELIFPVVQSRDESQLLSGSTCWLKSFKSIFPAVHVFPSNKWVNAVHIHMAHTRTHIILTGLGSSRSPVSFASSLFSLVSFFSSFFSLPGGQRSPHTNGCLSQYADRLFIKFIAERDPPPQGGNKSSEAIVGVFLGCESFMLSQHKVMVGGKFITQLQPQKVLFLFRWRRETLPSHLLVREETVSSKIATA